MEKITPRWEWRSFGPSFGGAEAQLAALTPEGVQESDEVYLLSGAGGNVKVLADLMNIKVLQQVNADGHEQGNTSGRPLLPPTGTGSHAARQPQAAGETGIVVLASGENR